jgi:hypothetical protein
MRNKFLHNLYNVFQMCDFTNKFKISLMFVNHAQEFIVLFQRWD